MKRTPHAVIFLRYFLFINTPNVAFAIFWNNMIGWSTFIQGLMLGWFGMSIVIWFAYQWITNSVVKTFGDRQEYDRFRNAGGDYFYDTLGPLFNNDSEETRQGYTPLIKERRSSYGVSWTGDQTMIIED